MTTNELKLRTKNFSLMVIDLVEKLPNTISVRVIAIKLLKVEHQLVLIIEQFVGQEAIENLFLK
jgi:hypothetical protein